MSSRFAPDEFLSPPDTAAPSKLVRATSSYADAQAFRYPSGGRNYVQQYSHIYFNRLKAIRPKIWEAVQKRFESTPEDKVPVFVERMLQLPEGRPAVVVGTLYKEMEFKPRMLNEYVDERWVPPRPPRENYCSDSDHFVLEDESGRVRVIGDALRVDEMVTGVIACVIGTERDDGVMVATDVVVADLPPQPPRPAPQPAGDGVRYVALVSGLRFGDARHQALAVQCMADYLTGHLGSRVDQQEASRVVRVIIAGNSVSTAAAGHTGPTLALQGQGGEKAKADLRRPVKQFEQLLTQLCSTCPVDIVPGEDDPSTVLLPQEPLHPTLLGTAARFSTCHAVSNPHAAAIDDIQFLGTAGQNVSDVALYTRFPQRIDALEATLRWRHVLPTCPDTLPCHPFDDRDPFVIEACPHVYYAGCQPTFDTRVVTGAEGQAARLVLVPDFTLTRQIALLDLGTLECRVVAFDV